MPLPSEEPLIKKEPDEDVCERTPEELFNNFVVMTVCFSINHATVAAMIALATSSLGERLGSLQTALLYTFYTLTALFGAKLVVNRTGYKWGVVAGLGLYVVYVGSFILAAYFPSIEWIAACIGGSLGGVAAGFLWTAQGAYFACNAKLYAEASEQKLEHVNARFAAVFAVAYLGFEVLFKLLQTAVGSTGPATLDWAAGKNFIYVINTICAVLSALACCSILPMPAPKQAPVNTTREILSAGKLFISDPKMPLMTGINLTFGVVSAYVNGYIISTVATHYLGLGYAGYLASVAAATGGLLSVPNALNCISHEWKGVLMVLGLGSFGMVCLLPMALGFDRFGSWSGLVLLFTLQGVGRGVWEATNKTFFAEYFAYDTVGGFSNIIIQNGAASSIAFYVNAYSGALPACSPTGQCGAYQALALPGVFLSATGILGFVLASRLHSAEICSWSQLAGRSSWSVVGNEDLDDLDTANPISTDASNENEDAETHCKDM
eukprot:TRINITY_DN4216_c0_g1_i1.p1 TRINITY_DN4216_c0_g1~~TRINITY_DN4216_c0_g1_i1.p1  ORF type:complete len:493 (-),score=108.54 TRINITY_DN4216_c0_g1_i1:146-1624(-)